MLQLSPLLADPWGTRPSTVGSLREPGPHFTTGVVRRFSLPLIAGTCAGVSPPACPSANRSFSGFGAPTATVAAATAGTALATVRISRSLLNAPLGGHDTWRRLVLALL